MAIGTGSPEVISAARALLMQDSILDAQGVYWGQAPHESDLPYLVLTIQSNTPTRGLNAPNKYRTVGLLVNAFAQSTGGRSAIDIASELQRRAIAQLVEPQGIVTAQSRWNVALVSDGWQAQVPLEASEVPAHMDTIGDVQRWKVGNLYWIAITQTGF